MPADALVTDVARTFSGMILIIMKYACSCLVKNVVDNSWIQIQILYYHNFEEYTWGAQYQIPQEYLKVTHYICTIFLISKGNIVKKFQIPYCYTHEHIIQE